jgi:hypothetical protein
MREFSEQDEKNRDALGVVPRAFPTRGPKMIPQVDYEHIFVLDAQTNLVGEYALNDDCPLQSSDLMRSLPVSGLRHLVSFYQGEYAFTPFKVDDLWFVMLTRGVPRIEDRGSVGTLLAAARIHIPPMIEPLLTKKEADLRAREQELAERESELARREQRAGTIEAQVRVASTQLKDLEADVRSREAKLTTLRDYAVQMQRTFIPPKEEKPKDGTPPTSLPVSPA